jgi:hypothetical protein
MNAVEFTKGLDEDPAAFVKWALENKYDMTCHPLHFLFLAEKTAAARAGWKAAMEHVESQKSEPSEARKVAMKTYAPPFKFHRGYVFDAGGHMVADDDMVKETVATRVRGWGYINGRFPEPEKLQDEIGAMIADALTEYYKNKGVV